MRDAAGQLADSVHLLGLDQLVFEGPLVADVGDRSGEFERPSVEVFKQHRLVEKMLVGAISGTASDIRSISFPDSASALPVSLCTPVAIVGMQPIPPDSRDPPSSRRS